MGQRRRFWGGVASLTVLLGKHAVPLTQSLGIFTSNFVEATLCLQVEYGSAVGKCGLHKRERSAKVVAQVIVRVPMLALPLA